MSQERAVKVIERIRELGLTNRAVADAIGVQERAVYRWFNYEREPRLSFDQVAALCTLLGWTVQQLAEAYHPTEAQ
ncbi:helix-turn-helix transcriptional regulator [Nodosilinea sp. PGN35]|uniref:helix-turn-helix transcriptional regulator n=1 Tax=Nodosilinea sp. PGN35 TaxID=3020489 RepID=UPI00351D852E